MTISSQMFPKNRVFAFHIFLILYLLSYQKLQLGCNKKHNSQVELELNANMLNLVPSSITGVHSKHSLKRLVNKNKGKKPAQTRGLLNDELNLI